MNKKITIDPVTRVEGHGRVTIHLDEYGQVENCFFHITEFRGFERFIQGHPYWETPVKNILWDNSTQFFIRSLNMIRDVVPVEH